MKKNILQLTLFIAALCVSLQSLAFASAVNVIGDVSVLNMQGEVRPLQKGMRVDSRETIVTGDSSEALIRTDDHSLIILKPNSKFLIQVSRDNGLEARLLKGSMYGDANQSGASANRKHRISTAYGIATLVDAKYEVSVLEKQNESATYLKVIEGGGRLSARAISVALKPQDLAISSNRETPRLITLAPDAVFVKAELNSQLSKARINTNSAKQAKKNTRIAQDCAQNSPAQKVLDDFISAYERGDIAYIQRRLDPAMIGYSAMLSNMMKDVNVQKQMRFLIQNRNVQCGPDLAVVNFKWEKRFLDLSTFRPRLLTGQAAILTHLKKGEWKLSGVSGDNPFAPRLNQPTILIASPESVRVNAIGIVPVPSQIRLISSDLAGAGIVQVEATAGGDRELLTLTEVQPGVFLKNNFDITDTATAPGDGVLFVNLGGTTTYAFRYRNLKTGLIASDVLTVIEF